MTVVERRRTGVAVFEPSDELNNKLVGYSVDGGFYLCPELSPVPFDALRGQIVRIMEDGYLNFCVRRFLVRIIKPNNVKIEGSEHDPTTVDISGRPTTTFLELRTKQDNISRYYGAIDRLILIRCFLDNDLLWETVLKRK